MIFRNFFWTESTLPWCRPVITDHSKHDRERRTISTAQSSDDEEPKAAMMIRNGRYAINIESCSSDGPNGNIPNDTYAADGKNFTVVTGINGCGKVRHFVSP